MIFQYIYIFKIHILERKYFFFTNLKPLNVLYMDNYLPSLNFMNNIFICSRNVYR